MPQLQALPFFKLPTQFSLFRSIHLQTYPNLIISCTYYLLWRVSHFTCITLQLHCYGVCKDHDVSAQAILSSIASDARAFSHNNVQTEQSQDII